jgi:hypothetical protein
MRHNSTCRQLTTSTPYSIPTGPEPHTLLPATARSRADEKRKRQTAEVAGRTVQSESRAPLPRAFRPSPTTHRPPRFLAVRGFASERVGRAFLAALRRPDTASSAQHVPTLFEFPGATARSTPRPAPSPLRGVGGAWSQDRPTCRLRGPSIRAYPMDTVGTLADPNPAPSEASHLPPAHPPSGGNPTDPSFSRLPTTGTPLERRPSAGQGSSM